MNRWLFLPGALVLGLLVGTPSTASAATVTSEFAFVNGLLQAQGVDCDRTVYYVCGIGTFDGRAAVSRVEYPTDQRLLLDQGCALYDTVEVVTLVDGSGELVIAHDDALLCGPNPNWLLHASPSSFGNPFRVTSDWTVVDGSGAYEDTSGTGTWSVRWAGGAGSGGHVGVLTD
ncbi:MAG TPA: hypothetical protein VK640_09790 [Actinomycetes bacterium]|nr:hypothetical protein [Actinomycetes bacterium]